MPLLPQILGATRAMAMELLYRMGGIKGAEIGEMMGVDYSTVSQGRRRLKEKLAKDKNFSLLMERIERRLSRINRVTENSDFSKTRSPNPA